MDDEARLSVLQAEIANYFGEFAKRIKARQELLREEIIIIDAKIAQLNEEIFIAFTELKKFEIALENAKQKKAAEENRKETIMLDEVASQQYHRKQQES